MTAPLAERPAGVPLVYLAEAQLLKALLLVGGLFLVAGIVVVALSGLNPSVIFAIFVFMSVGAPLLSAGALFLVERRGAPAAVRRGLGVIEAILLWLVLTVIVVQLAKPFMAAKTFSSWMSLLVFLVLAAVTLSPFRQRHSSASIANHFDVLFVLSLAVAVFILSPFDAAKQMPVGYLAYALETSNFWYWALVGVTWTAIGIWLRQNETWARSRTNGMANVVAIVLVILFILSLYDDGHYIHIMSYEPLVDPAMHVLRGGVPMVDAYSQYGLLPWLVFDLAYLKLPATFGTAAVVLRLINLAYFLVILAMVVVISKRRLSALWFLVPAFLATLTSHDPFPHQVWNVNAFPMMLGGRWLLPAGMALLLVSARDRALGSWGALLLIGLSAVASMEILAFTLASWGYCLLLCAIRMRSFRILVIGVLKAILAIAAAQTLLVLIVFAWTGQIIDYAPYFSILRDYRPVEGNGWSMTFDPTMALWFPIALSYFAIVAMASWRALRGGLQQSVVEQLLPVAVFGLGPLAYFFGRPQEPALTLSCLPFAVVVIGISQVVFKNPGRFGASGRALYAVLACSFAFVIADGFEHFTRPYDATQGNASILRRCFAPQGCLDAMYNINVALSSQVLDSRTFVGQGILVPSEFDTRQRIEELMSILRRLAPNTRDVGMVTDFWDPFGGNAHAISVGAAMATGNWRSWFFTAPFHDGQSSVVTERVLRRVTETPPGTLVVISNRKEGLVPLNQKILQTLATHCHLSPIETDKYHLVFRVLSCDGAKENAAAPK